MKFTKCMLAVVVLGTQLQMAGAASKQDDLFNDLGNESLLVFYNATAYDYGLIGVDSMGREVINQTTVGRRTELSCTVGALRNCVEKDRFIRIRGNRQSKISDTASSYVGICDKSLMIDEEDLMHIDASTQGLAFFIESAMDDKMRMKSEALSENQKKRLVMQRLRNTKKSIVEIYKGIQGTNVSSEEEIIGNDLAVRVINCMPTIQSVEMGLKNDGGYVVLSDPYIIQPTDTCEVCKRHEYAEKVAVKSETYFANNPLSSFVGSFYAKRMYEVPDVASAGKGLDITISPLSVYATERNPNDEEKEISLYNKIVRDHEQAANAFYLAHHK